MRNRILILAVLLAGVAVPSAAALDLNTEVSLPDAEVGSPYSFQFSAEEGCLPYRFSYSSGSLPPGLQITLDGRLTGTPTQAGMFTFFAAVDDSVTCMSPQSQGQFTLEVLPDLAVATDALAPPTIGVPYMAALASSGEDGVAVRWSITAGVLPPGLTLAQNGTISGTPTAIGPFTFVARIEEPFRRFGTKELTLSVVSPLAAAPPSVRTGEVGVPFAAQVTQTGGLAPVTWSVAGGTLPAGLALDAASGAISGRPTVGGRFRVTFQVQDAFGVTARAGVKLSIASRLAITTTTLRTARRGADYAARLRVRGGARPLTWTIVRGRLPSGIRLDRASGRLTGVARGSAQTYRFVVGTTDPRGGRVTRPLALRVTA